MALQDELPFTLRVVGGRPPEIPSGLRMEYVPWELENEVSYFRGLDVGLYPLVEDDWSRGKCGFKAIQYLSCGVPVVASPVGVIRDIVVHGETGFWAQSKGSWRDQLRILLTDGALRRTLGERGRKKVEEEYSVRAVVQTLARTLLRAAGR
jgi:glycosyltransferase involved in cell wall biosynthesis